MFPLDNLLKSVSLVQFYIAQQSFVECGLSGSLGIFKGNGISCKKLWFFWFGKAMYLHYAECDFIKSIRREHKQLWITDSVSGVRACRLGLAVKET